MNLLSKSPPQAALGDAFADRLNPFQTEARSRVRFTAHPWKCRRNSGSSVRCSRCQSGRRALSQIEPPSYVIGPTGELLTLDQLPPRETRWTIRRKAEVVAAIRGGLLTFDEACSLYSLEIEELTTWQRCVQRSGMAGLRVTRIQEYRDRYERRDGY